VFWTGLASSGSKLRRASLKWGVAVVVASGWVAGGPAVARMPDTPGGQAVVALATLPPQAQATHRLILSGGPFPYDKDGTVFGNRERLLPAKARGYYREYTVKTPGSRDRGARRLVCGGIPPTTPDACYYTDDHYNSFRRVIPTP
jgi:ribonuclease T1